MLPATTATLSIVGGRQREGIALQRRKLDGPEGREGPADGSSALCFLAKFPLTVPAPRPRPRAPLHPLLTPFPRLSAARRGVDALGAGADASP